MSSMDVTTWQERLAARGITPADDVPEGMTDEDRAEMRRVQAENRAVRWRTSLPVMFAEARLDDLDPKFQGVREWLNTDSATLLLAGSIGTGKTHAAYAVGNAAVDRGLYVAAITVHDLLEAARPDGDKRKVQDAENADVLILDDLGANKASDFATDFMTALMDLRLREGRRQVVTTNWTAADLEQAWGGRLLDRLRFRRTVALFTGESRRASW